MNFLNRVAKDLWDKHAQEISNFQFVFPNKRAGQWFISTLSEVIDQNIKAPECYSIEDFIERNSSYKIAGHLELSFTLFHSYKKYIPEEDFEKFNKWGNLILTDYDEIDKQLVHAERLFKNLSNIKELESDEIQEPLQKEFWDNLQTGSSGFLHKQFIALWDVYRLTYYDFKEALSQKGLAYAGMCYREVAEKFSSGQSQVHQKVVFIGLNALSKSEEGIISILLENQMAEIYWDMDEYYISNPREESGHFIRRALKNLPFYDTLPPVNRLLVEKKRINIVGVPLQIGQTKSFGEEIRQFLDDKDIKSTAVILPDENLLIPILHSLPANVEDLNITVGYPLANCAVFSFLELVISLQINYSVNYQSFNYKDVLQILTHPFVAFHENQEIALIIADIEEKNRIYISSSDLQFKDESLTNIIFNYIAGNEMFISYLIEVVKDIKVHKSLNEDEQTYCDELIKVLSDQQSIILNKISDVSIPSIIRIFRETVKSKKINLTQQGVKGIQIMGLLETRCLNFENIFILSVNEGVLPANRKSHSYIPFDLRKAFGLPTSDEQESLYAYYFYRLIQGAKNIFLFYNDEAGTKGEEKSRYIRQIEQYLAKENSKIELIYKNYSLPIITQDSRPIIIIKDNNFFKYFEKKNIGNGISPSLIISYFTCPLQFLLKSVNNLEPLKEVSDDWEANDFGDYFHQLMELIYQGKEGTIITEAFLKQKRQDLYNLLKNVFANNNKSKAEYEQNRNSLKVETIKILAEKVIDADISYTPFKLIGLEHCVDTILETNNHDFPNIKLFGKIDRIDEKDGLYRIVDYKTGKVQKTNFNFLEKEELKKDNKEAFQTLFYSYMFMHSNKEIQAVEPVILPLRNVVGGYKTVNSNTFKRSDMLNFEELLLEFIQDILNKEKPIYQTEDLISCSYCNYKNICLR